MEKLPVNPIDKNELLKTEQSVEQFSFTEQEKNIQEVFKISPKLKEIAYKRLGIENDIEIQIINQRIDNSNGNIYTSLNVYYKGDKIIDTEHEVKTKSLFKLCSLKDGTTFVSAVLLPEKLRGQGLYSKILQETANVTNQKIKNSATVFENSSENDYSISPSAEKVWNKLGNEIIPNYEAERLYQKYLETIFPKSKIKNIVWHGTTDKQEVINNGFNEKRKSKEYDYSHGAIFATSSIQDAETAGTSKGKYDVVPLIINVKNLGVSREGKINKENIDNLPFSSEDEINKIIQQNEENWNKLGWKYKILPNNILQLTKPQEFKYHGIWNENNDLVLDLSYNNGFIGQLKEADINILKSSGLDGIIAVDEHDLFGKQKVGNKSWYVVFESKNIHILGSKDDIEKFKEFVSENENK